MASDNHLGNHNEYNSNGRNGTWVWVRIFDVISRILLPIILGALVFATSTIISNERRISIIESNRHTAMDAMREQQAVYKELAEIRAMIPKEVPPTWFREKVQRIESDVAKLKEKTQTGCK